MGIRKLEAEILKELKEVAKNEKLRQKDILEWRTSTLTAQEGEVVFYLPRLGVSVCVKLLRSKR